MKQFFNKNQIILIFIVVILVIIAFIIFLLKGNQYNIANNTYSINIPDQYREAVIFTNNNRILSITPSTGENIQVEKFDSRFIYKDVYNNSDVIQTKEGSSIKEEIVFNSSDHPTSFEYTLGGIDDYYIERDGDGNIVFYDKENYKKNKPLLSRIFTIINPFLVDANGVKSISAAVMSIDNNKLSIILDTDWLSNAEYPVVLDPTVEINILNLHSNPQQGENWEVLFTTYGIEDLYIIPNDQATIEDDEFISLACDGIVKNSQILAGDVVYYPEWSCDGIGKVIHYTIKKGNHTLRFEFGDQVAYAYNASWWDSSFTKRRKITLDNSGQATALADFPVAIKVDSNRIDYTSTQNAGEDIRFIDADDTTELNHEIEKWNESGTSTLFVKVPNIAAASSTDFIWMYYSSSTAVSTATTTGVWDANFVMIQHLEEAVNTTSGGYTDSTLEGNDGTGVSMALTASTGIVGDAQDFDGTADFITMADTVKLRSGTGPYTMEAWFKAPNAPQFGVFVSKNTSDLNGRPATNMGISDNTFAAAGDSIAIYYGDHSISAYENWYPGNNITDNNWHYSTLSISSSVGTASMDGSVLTKTNDVGAPNDNNTNPMNIGACNTILGTGSACFFDGLLDEIRISNIDRSSDWLDFTYCNIKDTCMTYGSEETYAPPSSNASPTITLVTDSPDPVPANVDIYWNVDWADTDTGDMIKVFICKTNAITTSTPACTGGTWAVSPVFTNRDPEGLAHYTTTISDIGTLNYYAFVCDNSGDASTACSNSTSGSTTVEEQSPTAPINLLLQQMPNPVNIATTTPLMSSIFTDPNILDTANKYCIEVDTQSDFAGTQMWASDGNNCNTGTSMANCIQGDRCVDINYGGTAISLDSSVYYWRTWFWDDSGNISATSTIGNWIMSNGGNGVRLQGNRLNGGVRLK